MEPECPLPHSQTSATGSYPEPDHSSPSLPTHFLKIHFNIILPCTRKSSKWSISNAIPHRKPVYIFPVSQTCHMPRPSHSSWLYRRNNFWWTQTILLIVMYSSALPCYLDPLRPKSLSLHPIFGHPQAMFFLEFEKPSFTPTANIRQNSSSVYLDLIICG